MPAGLEPLSAPKPRGETTHPLGSGLASPPPGGFPGRPASISNGLEVPGAQLRSSQRMCWRGGGHGQLKGTCAEAPPGLGSGVAAYCGGGLLSAPRSPGPVGVEPAALGRHRARGSVGSVERGPAWPGSWGSDSEQLCTYVSLAVCLCVCQ